MGTYDVNFHDTGLIPINASPTERAANLSFKALSHTSLVVPMATTNLFSDPSFKDGTLVWASLAVLPSPYARRGPIFTESVYGVSGIDVVFPYAIIRLYYSGGVS